MTIRLALLSLAAAIFLAACGGSSDNEGGEGVFPTEEFQLTERELVTRIEAVEEEIAGCMAAAGFEYVALDADTVMDAMSGLGERPGASEEDYVAEFGYGVSTDFNNPGKAAVFGDQNIRVFDDLSGAGQVAYLRGLLGEDTNATFAFGLEVEDLSATGGCTRTAVEAFFTPEELSPAYVNPIDVKVQNDPRLIAAQGEWSDCMRKEGFDYESSENTDIDIQDRFDALAQGRDPEKLSGADLDALKELQALERALAVADLECFEEFVEEVEEEVESEVTGAPPGA